jgi:predicted 3-demethylubiquinone-9 3-methyltransferase (glyoxalase superfamily)
MQKITTFLSFSAHAEDAADFYVSLFKDSKIVRVSRYGEGAPQPELVGTVMVVEVELAGQPFVLLNGGPHFEFTDGISLSIACESQREVDELWEKLSANGGEPGPCGWIKDRFGVSWQVTPKRAVELLAGAGGEKSKRVWQAMMKMKKIDIAALERAAEG